MRLLKVQHTNPTTFEKLLRHWHIRFPRRVHKEPPQLDSFRLSLVEKQLPGSEDEILKPQKQTSRQATR